MGRGGGRDGFRRVHRRLGRCRRSFRAVAADTPRFGIDATPPATNNRQAREELDVPGDRGRRDWSPAREANARASAMDAISDTVPLTCPRAMTVPVDLVIAVAVAGEAMSRAAADASILDLIFGRVRYSLSLGARGKERGGLKSPDGPNTIRPWTPERSYGLRTALRCTRWDTPRDAVEFVAENRSIALNGKYVRTLQLWCGFRRATLILLIYF